MHISFDAYRLPCTLKSRRAGVTSFHRWRNKAQSGEEVKPEVIHRVGSRTQPGAPVVPVTRPADHLPLPQEAEAGWEERGFCSGTVLGPMLDAPTYQLRDLGQVSSPPCLSPLTSEMRTQRSLAGPALGPRAPSARAQGRCCPREGDTHHAPVPGGWQPVATATNSSSHPPPEARPAGATLHDSPGPA